MRPMVEKDLALFYTSAGRYQDAVSYYRRKGLDVGGQLLKVGKFLMDQEKFTNAQKVIESAKGLAKNRESRINANILLLGLYEKYGKYEKHYVAAKDLFDIHRRTLF